MFGDGGILGEYGCAISRVIAGYESEEVERSDFSVARKGGSSIKRDSLVSRLGTLIVIPASCSDLSLSAMEPPGLVSGSVCMSPLNSEFDPLSSSSLNLASIADDLGASWESCFTAFVKTGKHTG